MVNGDKLTIRNKINFENKVESNRGHQHLAYTLTHTKHAESAVPRAEVVLTLGACGVFGFWKNLVISAFSALMRCGRDRTAQLSQGTLGRQFCACRLSKPYPMRRLPMVLMLMAAEEARWDLSGHTVPIEPTTPTETQKESTLVPQCPRGAGRAARLPFLPPVTASLPPVSASPLLSSSSPPV